MELKKFQKGIKKNVLFLLFEISFPAFHFVPIIPFCYSQNLRKLLFPRNLPILKPCKIIKLFYIIRKTKLEKFKKKSTKDFHKTKKNIKFRFKISKFFVFNNFLHPNTIPISSYE